MKKIIIFIFCFLLSFQMNAQRYSFGYIPPFARIGILGYEKVNIKPGTFTKAYGGFSAPTEVDVFSYYLFGVYFTTEWDNEEYTNYNVLGYPVKVGVSCSKWGISLGELFIIKDDSFLKAFRIGATIVHNNLYTYVHDTSGNWIGWNGYPDFSEEVKCWGIKIDASVSFITFSFETSKYETAFGISLTL